MKLQQRKLMNIVLALVLAFSNTLYMPTAAATDIFEDSGTPTGEEMLADGLLVRPSMIVGTVLGTVAFVLTLPFSVLGGNVDEAGKALVVEPAAHAFVRPLGEM